MATDNLRKWDTSEHLKTLDEIQAYLDACVEIAVDDAGFMSKVHATVERARKLLASQAKPLDPGLRRDDDFEGEAS